MLSHLWACASLYAALAWATGTRSDVLCHHRMCCSCSWRLVHECKTPDRSFDHAGDDKCVFPGIKVLLFLPRALGVQAGCISECFEVHERFRMQYNPWELIIRWCRQIVSMEWCLDERGFRDRT